jgi:SHS family lactate transporter-like MFS transporter
MQIPHWSTWTSQQKHVVVASWLGWTLDAFDYFLFVFVLADIAKEFQVPVTQVTVALLLTLAMRPLGALLFGRAADRFGRRPVLMVDVLAYSAIGFACAFAPSLGVLLVLRALFGVAMGGEWGVGASLTMESVPAQARGFVSGILQSGYPSGYLLAAIAYATLFPLIGWRGMFMLGVVPALLALYIRSHVPESPAWAPRHRAARSGGTLDWLRAHWKRAVYAVALMTAFNFFSHGSQDLYPTFLRVQRHLSPRTVGSIAVVYNIGAMLGGIVCGTLSERWGRRRVITLAALLALPVLPLWVLPTQPALIAVGAFSLQFMVQGAWGVIPAHLNELSPRGVRGTFPGFVYQLGNLFASANATLQASIAAHYGGNYALALGLVLACVSVVIALLCRYGREARGVAFEQRDTAEASS